MHRKRPGVTRGSTCDTPIQVLDWLPTLLNLAGAKIPTGYANDGADITELLAGKEHPERLLYWYAPLYDLRWGATPAAAIRRGRYKLIEFFGDSFAPMVSIALAGVWSCTTWLPILARPGIWPRQSQSSCPI